VAWTIDETDVALQNHGRLAFVTVKQVLLVGRETLVGFRVVALSTQNKSGLYLDVNKK
jgi:hypothetical protein